MRYLLPSRPHKDKNRNVHSGYDGKKKEGPNQIINLSGVWVVVFLPFLLEQRGEEEEGLADEPKPLVLSHFTKQGLVRSCGQCHLKI